MHLTCRTGSQRQRKKVDFDEAIDLTGNGKFHYILLLACGISYAAGVLQLVGVSVLLPAAGCDFKLTSADKGWMSGIPFVGMILGTCTWGVLADVKGRRWTLFISHIVAVFGTIGSALGQTFWLFLGFRFISGFGMIGAMYLVWPYLAEFQPNSRRGTVLSTLSMFWNLGNILVPALAWLVIPQHIDYITSFFAFNSWRAFILLWTIPTIIAVILFIWLPESPRFLLATGKLDDAQDVITRMYILNTGRSKWTSPLLKETLCHERSKDDSEESGLVRVLNELHDTIAKLFIPPLLKYTLIVIAMEFSILVGYNTLDLWFPELFERFQDYHRLRPNQSVSICDISASVIAKMATANNENSPNIPLCSHPIDQRVFLSTLIVSLSPLPTTLWTICCMDKLGSKFFLIFSLLLSGASVIALYFVKDPNMNLVFACVFTAFMAMGFTASGCLEVELYSTNLRATALSLAQLSGMAASFLGNIMFGSLVDVDCFIPIFVIAGILIGAGLLCLFLPDTKSMSLT